MKSACSKDAWDFVPVLQDMISLDDAPEQMRPALYLLQASMSEKLPKWGGYVVIVEGIGAVYYSKLADRLDYMVDSRYLKQQEASCM